MEREGMKGEGMVFADRGSAARAGRQWRSASARQNQVRVCRRSTKKATKCSSALKPRRVVLRLGALLPRLNAKAPFELVNRLLRKKEVQQVIDTVYRYCGQKESSSSVIRS